VRRAALILQNPGPPLNWGLVATISSSHLKEPESFTKDMRDAIDGWEPIVVRLEQKKHINLYGSTLSRRIENPE